LLIELHLLQSFPVSNLNRDDIGQPKTARFGGCTRGRISSQSQKRAARDLFTKYGLEPAETGQRTKRLRETAARLLESSGHDKESVGDIAQAGLEALGFGIDSRGLSEYLLFVGQPAAQELASFCEVNWDELAKAVAAKERTAKKTAAAKKTAQPQTNETAKQAAKAKVDAKTEAAAKRILDASRVADIALFGRMIADNKGFNVNAACQVAHALSTHAVANEFDYYTALDDLKPDAEPGADMIGTVDFNSACYYRYANVDLDQLAVNLPGDGDLVFRSARAWLQAFIHAVPGGKQNSMAARTVPATLLGVVRTDGAWSLANAFLRPLGDVPDLMAGSTERMMDHFHRTRSLYGAADLRHVAYASLTADEPGIPDVTTSASVEDFVSGLLKAARA
jgi:CRISPR system Cascade subunit CasC